MNKEVANKPTLKDFVYGFKDEFNLVKTSDNIDFEKEALFACQAFSNNPYLMKVAKDNGLSAKNAILNVAAVGLTLNPVSQLAYLVPRTINKVPAICLDISYKGLIRTATDSGSILWAQAELFYEDDTFELISASKEPTHKRNPFKKERGKILGAYVVVKTLEGDFLTTTMGIDEIYKIRDKSESWKSINGRKYSPWLNFEGEMIKKTVIKRASKTWPRTDKIHMLEKAVDVVNEHEGINFEKEKSFNEESEADFPRKPADMALGNEYLVVRGKYRDSRLKEISLDDINDHIQYIEGRLEKEDKRYMSKDWIEKLDAFKDFSANYEMYQDILNEDK